MGILSALLTVFADANSVATTDGLPMWAVSLISLVISTAVTTLVGLVITRAVKRHYEQKDEEEATTKAEREELKRRRDSETRSMLRQDVQQIVDAAIQPVTEKIDILVDKMSKTEEGTLSSLRNDILTCYYRCVEKGYRGDWDYENIHHLFSVYSALNGNSFVGDVMKRFDELPTKEDYLRQETESDVMIKPKKSKGDK